MKKLALALPLIALLNTPVFAQEEVIVEDAVEQVRERRGDQFRAARAEIRTTITDYMLENGDITQEELDALQAEREAVREELRSLRESGDREALQARLEELRETRSERRDEFRAYLDENEDLRTALVEQREALREERDARRQERLDQREERREERRQRREDAQNS